MDASTVQSHMEEHVLLLEFAISKLELSAAVIAVQNRQTNKKRFEYKGWSKKFWTDSISVLKGIRNENRRFYTFESNRLTVIRNGYSVSV